MLQVEIARRAQRDLEDIYDYGVETFGLATADSYAADLMHATSLLAEFPEIGEAIPGRSDGIRRLSCRAHLIVHRRVGNTILIARVLHARMDLKRHI
jgi:toxin ParE1/3/4